MLSALQRSTQNSNDINKSVMLFPQFTDVKSVWGDIPEGSHITGIRVSGAADKWAFLSLLPLRERIGTSRLHCVLQFAEYSGGVVRHLPACASHGRRVGLAVRGGGRIKWKEGSMSVMKLNEIRR